MMRPLLRAGLLLAAVALAGCTDTNLETIAKANKELPAKLVAAMKKKGMARNAPVMVRIFKEEGKLEVWKQKQNGRYDLITEYDICKFSGKLGPKFIEGDRQAPEGFYSVKPAQMNPNSSYYLSFNIGYPNAYDRAHGRSGSHLMVHGGCSSSGCYAVTDEQVAEIFALGREAFKGGQTEFQIQAFPFRMTPANMARYKDDPNYAFWRNLKEGYDHFELTKVPPKVDVCEKRYVFNVMTEPGQTLSPTGPCPSSAPPEALQTAFKSYQSTYEAAFAMALSKGVDAAPKPSIAGLQEAKLVSEWTKKRARGERIPLEPPSLNPDGTVTVSAQMGRIDSPAGRKQAEKEAAEAAKRQAEEEKKLAVERRMAEQAAAKLAAAEAEAAAAAQPVAAEAAPAPAAVEPAPAEKSGVLGGLRQRLGGLLGG